MLGYQTWQIIIINSSEEETKVCFGPWTRVHLDLESPQKENFIVYKVKHLQNKDHSTKEDVSYPLSPQNKWQNIACLIFSTYTLQIHIYHLFFHHLFLLQERGINEKRKSVQSPRHDLFSNEQSMTYCMMRSPLLYFRPPQATVGQLWGRAVASSKHTVHLSGWLTQLRLLLQPYLWCVYLFILVRVLEFRSRGWLH